MFFGGGGTNAKALQNKAFNVFWCKFFLTIGEEEPPIVENQKIIKSKKKKKNEKKKM